MAKLLLILILGGAFADGLASTHEAAPMLIQDTTAAPLDAAN